MKNKKNLFVVLMVIVIVAGMLVIAGCGEDNNSGDNKEKIIDPATLAADVVKNVKFEVEMTQIDSAYFDVYYTLAEGTNGVSYKAGGKLSDEITVFAATDEANAKKDFESIKKYVDERKATFADYAPAEVQKLEKSYLIQKGKYVVLCVTNDIENAKTIIDKAF